MSNTRKPLSIQEIEKLLLTPSAVKEVKSSLIVDIYTGLQFDHLINLTGDNLIDTPEGKHIIDVPENKHQPSYRCYINSEIRKLLGEHIGPDTYVFPELQKTSVRLIKLYAQEWGTAAGLDRNLTYILTGKTYKSLAEASLYKKRIYAYNYPKKNPVCHRACCGMINELSSEQFLVLAQLNDVGVDFSKIYEDSSIR